MLLGKLLCLLQSVCVVLGGQAIKSNGNELILREEIEGALRECGGAGEGGQPGGEFGRRANSARLIKENVRSKRNLNMAMEQINEYLKGNKDNLHEEESAGSGEWEYAGGNRKSTWDDESSSGEDAGDYQHRRRNTTSDGFSEGSGNRTVQGQNATRHNRDDYKNNFDSRGAALHRQKRSDLSRVASQNKCLNQCVFNNLNVVDDRGIPKESLLIKLIDGAITSQQMKGMVENIVHDCFHQLTGEPQDDGCSYSNALEHCMGLEIQKRNEISQSKINDSTTAKPE